MTIESGWRRQLPTEEGYYWFWGYLFGPPTLVEKGPRLEQVQVRRVRNGLAFIGCGTFIDEHEAIGLWHKNVPPEPPKDVLK